MKTLLAVLFTIFAFTAYSQQLYKYSRYLDLSTAKVQKCKIQFLVDTAYCKLITNGSAEVFFKREVDSLGNHVYTNQHAQLIIAYDERKRITISEYDVHGGQYLYYK